MIRMSEIIKASEEHGPAKARQDISLLETKKEDIAKAIEAVEIGKLDAQKLYMRGLSLIAEDIMPKVRSGAAIDPNLVLSLVSELTEVMMVEDHDLFVIFYKSAPPAAYLAVHSFNVGLLAIKIGIWSKLNRSELTDLAIAGLLHDIGMVKVESITKKEGPLNDEERSQVAKHAEYGGNILKGMGCFGEQVLSAVRNHHKFDSGDRLSQFLGLADIFEAMTHPRVYKNAKLPHEAIAEIIAEESRRFLPEAVKMFINNIGIYPMGSWVRLNTREVGIITGVNKDYPLRPKVNVIFDRSGQRLLSTKVLDLASGEPHIYIDAPIDMADYEKK